MTNPPWHDLILRWHFRLLRTERIVDQLPAKAGIDVQAIDAHLEQELEAALKEQENPHE